MSIGNIRNPLLRRGAMVLVVPVYLVTITSLGVIAALWEGACAACRGARYGWNELMRDSLRVIRRAW